jgi:hypothetical protein
LVTVVLVTDNMRPSNGEGAVVIVDRPVRVVDREGGR